MLLRDYLPTNCDTSGLGGLTKQIAETLLAKLPPDKVIDISPNVLKKHNWIWRGHQDPPHFNYHGGSDPDFGHTGIKAFQKLWNQHNPDDQIDEDGSYGDDTQKRLEASPIDGF